MHTHVLLPALLSGPADAYYGGVPTPAPTDEGTGRPAPDTTPAPTPDVVQVGVTGNELGK